MVGEHLFFVCVPDWQTTAKDCLNRTNNHVGTSDCTTTGHISMYGSWSWAAAIDTVFAGERLVIYNSPAVFNKTKMIASCDPARLDHDLFLIACWDEMARWPPVLLLKRVLA